MMKIRVAVTGWAGSRSDAGLPEGVADAGGENIPGADFLGDDGEMCGGIGDEDDLHLRQTGVGAPLAQQRRVRHVPGRAAPSTLPPGWGQRR